MDESYNANPASVRAALSTLATIETGPRGRRIAVLGDMLELGAGAEAHHRDLEEAIEANAVDLRLHGRRPDAPPVRGSPGPAGAGSPPASRPISSSRWPGSFGPGTP